MTISITNLQVEGETHKQDQLPAVRRRIFRQMTSFRRREMTRPTITIALNQIDLHKSFVGLQEVLKPYQSLLAGVPGTWKKIICGSNPSGFLPVCGSIMGI